MTDRILRIAFLILTALSIVKLLPLNVPGLPLGGSDASQMAIVAGTAWLVAEASSIIRGE
ncbi:hypothetical protein [Shinella sp. JR1-6]|uniref:hypothetical protein n=1 Tax=Shinella sp. JR1-6 TaxID=2527671 RepID=UPI00102D3FCB|nr:hypothetical protein [Shinella sp. JR1-6]TAA55292.1 hypothetical protein EXZ48_24990 [Shinella sp. JR1-6]